MFRVVASRINPCRSADAQPATPGTTPKIRGATQRHCNASFAQRYVETFTSATAIVSGGCDAACEAARLEREEHEHHSEHDGEGCDQPEERDHALYRSREHHDAEQHGHEP